jgi:hypothetical protein
MAVEIITVSAVSALTRFMREGTMDTPAFADLLRQAVTEPGTISKAYSQFHNYSFGNQLLAWSQCIQREITPGPLGTFMHWKALGRHVTKGEKALTLCMPVTIKRKGEAPEGAEDQPEAFTRFVYRNRWFVLAQTEGQALPPSASPQWISWRWPLSTFTKSSSIFSTGIARGLHVSARLQSARSALCRIRHVSMRSPTSCSATPPRAHSITASRPRAVCASVKPKQWPSCVAPHWIYRVSSWREDISKRGGELALPSRSAALRRFSRLSIRF